jgi:protein O-GlcNAc transferase
MPALLERGWQEFGHGNWAAALAYAEACLQEQPPSAEAARLCALAQFAAGQRNAARATLESFVPIGPGNARFWNDLGILRLQSDDASLAADAFAHALAEDPSLLATHLGRAHALQRLSAWQEALPHWQHCVTQAPKLRTHLLGLLQCLLQLGRAHEAQPLADAWLSDDPHDAEILRFRSQAAHLQNRAHAALQYARRARLALPQEDYAFVAEHALAAWSAGETAEMDDALNDGLQLSPTSLPLHDDLMWAMLHSPHWDGEQQRALLEHGRQYWSHGLRETPQHENCRLPQRTLRIGFLGGEFLLNSAWSFLACWIQALDAQQCRKFFYMTRTVSTANTAPWKEMNATWCQATALSDDELYATIIADKIDILVDCSGHFPFNRLNVFARKAAPIQVSFPHCPATTGLPQIDFVLSDQWTSPVGSESEYSEQVWRLSSGYLAFAPRHEAPAPSPASTAPVLGLFQRPGKYHAAFWPLVGNILCAVPNATLLCHYDSPELDEVDSAARQQIQRLLAAEGIDAQRLLFAGSRAWHQHMKLVGSVDLALDSFPYNGQTTTCDCLWMGVPVVTLRGNTHAGRVAEGLLARVGLPQLCAATPADYISIAVDFARNLPLRQQLRQSLPSTARNVLGNSAQLAHEIEHAFRSMWLQWLEKTD